VAGEFAEPVLTVERTAGDYRLVIDPARGGSVAAFTWRGQNLFRPTCGPSILDTGSFPLVPFSNRIAHGRFGDVTLTPNLPGSDHPHPLHGFGWLSAWRVIADDSIEHIYQGGEWPWAYRAVQKFTLNEDGVEMALTLTNLADAPMPAGLGFHPYFPRTPDAVYRGLHRGEWQNTPDCLPERLDEKEHAVDWWNGQPVGTRAVDTVYTGRSGNLEILWPSRQLALEIAPSGNLPFTVVYTPKDADFFCVEPVSHETDAINRGGLPLLAPGGTMTARMTLRARQISL
jgi:aldose 1-epimerase